MTKSAHQPQGHKGPADAPLPKLVRQLQQVLRQAQRGFAYDTLRLDAQSLGELAEMLVDFAADLHCGTGIWKAYERYNIEFFGTALPLAAENNVIEVANEFHPGRFRHFLWVLYPVFLEGLVLSPEHQDLQKVAQAVSAFLADAFATTPSESGVKSFLGTSNEFGWDVKRKLVWLGTHSFLFRAMFSHNMEETDNALSVIGRTDDFVCQECTAWSGLGAIVILAGILDISDDDRRDLRGWYERHGAYDKVTAASCEMVEAVNVVNQQPYRIRVNIEKNPFNAGQLVFGSTIPWRGQWYWSGAQQVFGKASDFDIGELVNKMKRQTSAVVCRYAMGYEQQVREQAAEIHRKSLAFHQGQDLIVHPDGLAMAADMQKELRWHWESMPPEQGQAVARKHGLARGRPEINLPKHLVGQKDGLGVFLNPDEGQEIMTMFTPLIAGFKKKGKGLTEDEEGAIRGFMESDSVSPGFVRRVAQEYGTESI